MSYIETQFPDAIRSISFTRLSPNTAQVQVNGLDPTTIANISETIGKKKTNSDPRIVIKNRREQLKYVFKLSALTTINGVQWTGTNVQNAINLIMAAVFGGDGDTLAKFSQTITFPAPANRVHTAPPFSAGASVDSGLPLTYASSNGAVATVDAVTGIITPVGAGTCNITVSQAGDANYNAATNVVQPLTLT